MPDVYDFRACFSCVTDYCSLYPGLSDTYSLGSTECFNFRCEGEVSPFASISATGQALSPKYAATPSVRPAQSRADGAHVKHPLPLDHGEG